MAFDRFGKMKFPLWKGRHPFFVEASLLHVEPFRCSGVDPTQCPVIFEARIHRASLIFATRKSLASDREPELPQSLDLLVGALRQASIVEGGETRVVLSGT